jgi:hypothetical protein
MSALSLVEELQRKDEATAAVLAEVESLAAAAARLRRRAGELDVFLTRAPQERRRRAEAAAAADARLDDARRELADVEQRLARARDHGRRREVEELERLEAGARELVRVAAAERELARSGTAALDRHVESAELEAAQIERDAAAVGRRVAGLPRIPPEARVLPRHGLDGVADWAAGARGALLVVRSSLAAEREALVREANELGASLLGGGLQTASIARVREQLARAFGKPASP